MNNLHCKIASHKPHRATASTFRIAAVLFSFTLLSSFSGDALSKNAVHKCIEPDGHFEFTDKKCGPDETVPVADKTAAQTEPASAGKSPEPSHALTQHKTVINQPNVNTESTSSH